MIPVVPTIMPEKYYGQDSIMPGHYGGNKKMGAKKSAPKRNGLTAKQMKLPAGLRKAILASMKKKKGK